MKYLSDTLLLEVYERAVNLQLEPDFIELLYKEMHFRNLLSDEILSEGNRLVGG